MIKKITISDVELISFKLAKEKLGFKEPIPEFSTRFPNRLEGCLLTPFQTYDKKHLYKGLLEKAAIFFYLMIKNHPFINGNKRIAMTTLLVFLFINGKWIKIDSKELYNFAVWVAGSPAKLKNETVVAVQSFLKEYLVERQ